MKLFDGGKAPNPRRVRIFLAEKGLPLPPLVPIDLNQLEHKREPFAERNPWQQVPVLELDDGTVIAESMAICRYFEEAHPEPALFGTGARERAIVEMWNRRAEFGLLSTAAAAFRHLRPEMAQMEVPQVTAWGEANRVKAASELARFDAHLAHNAFLAGPAFTVADITAGIAIDFMKPARIEVPEALVNLRRWYATLKARPSWSA